MMTNGVVRLSYCATSTRNTKSSPIANTRMVCGPLCTCWRAMPLQSYFMPLGMLSVASFAIAFERLPGTRVRARRAVDFVGVEFVEPHDRRRWRWSCECRGAAKPASGCRSGIGDVDAGEILRYGTVLRAGLNHDVVRAASVVEEVDEGRTGRCVERVEEARRRNAERQRLGAIELRARTGRSAASECEPARAVCLCCALARIVSPTRLSAGKPKSVDVLNLDGEAAGRTQSGNRRRIRRQRGHPRNLWKCCTACTAG